MLVKNSKKYNKKKFRKKSENINSLKKANILIKNYFTNKYSKTKKTKKKLK